jgi:hypothetical protein
MAGGRKFGFEARRADHGNMKSQTQHPPALQAARFHRLFGPARRRIAYHRGDFLDYSLMILGSAAVIGLAYGASHRIAQLGFILCAFMLVAFPMRHGVAIRVPVLLRRPQDLLYMVIYKAQNIVPMYLVGIAVFMLDNCVIWLTPGLPHQTGLMRTIAVDLFYAHFILIASYRTVILMTHLHRRDIVRAVLMKTPWRSVVARQPNITFQILHAYCTGMLTHIILIAPWYIVMTHCLYSVITLPVVFMLNVVVHARYMCSFSAWFYRDHWLSHNAEFEFLYLHGTHHDAIPSGLIGVSGNGYLEGFLRHTVGSPAPLYSAPAAFLLYTLEVIQDINNHQYIPGIFPKLTRRFHEVTQHSTHHYGRLQPYSIGLKLVRPDGGAGPRRSWQFPPEELLNSIALDEQLNGFQWDNPQHRRFLELVDEFQK